MKKAIFAMVISATLVACEAGDSKSTTPVNDSTTVIVDSTKVDSTSVKVDTTEVKATEVK